MNNMTKTMWVVYDDKGEVICYFTKKEDAEYWQSFSDGFEIKTTVKQVTIEEI